MSIVRAKKNRHERNRGKNKHAGLRFESDEFFDFIYRRIEGDFEVAAFVVIEAGDGRFRDRECGEDEVTEGVRVRRRDIVCGE